jgi:CBS domain-containing protein
MYPENFVFAAHGLLIPRQYPKLDGNDAMMIEKLVKKVVTARPQETLAGIARLMEEHNVGAVVIVEKSKPVGMITDRDIALALGAHKVSPDSHVSEIMTSPVETIHVADGTAAITEYMRDFKVRRLAVVDDEGRLAGILTLDDLLGELAEEMANLMSAIKPEMAVHWPNTQTKGPKRGKVET